MAYTISNALTSLSYRLGETTVPTSSSELNKRIDWLKTAISRTAGDGRLWWFMQKLDTTVTVAYQKKYSQPTRCRRIQQIKIDGYQYEEIEQSDVYEKYETSNSPVPILPSYLARAFYIWDEYYYPIPIPDTAPTAKSVTTLTSSGTTATCTITDHGWESDDYITIAGANESAYNGNFQITKTGANTFTYTMASDPADTATGTITATKDNIEIWYWETPSIPTATTDSIVVPDDYMDILVAYGEGRYWSSAHKRGKAADAFVEFETLYAKLIDENTRKKFLAT